MVNYDFYTRIIDYLISTLPISNIIFDKRNETSSGMVDEENINE